MSLGDQHEMRRAITDSEAERLARIGAEVAPAVSRQFVTVRASEAIARGEEAIAYYVQEQGWDEPYAREHAEVAFHLPNTTGPDLSLERAENELSVARALLPLLTPGQRFVAWLFKIKI